MTIEYYDAADNVCATCLEKVVFTFSGTCSYATPACSITENGSVSADLYSPCETFASNETCSRCVLHSLATCVFDEGDACLFSVTNTSTTHTVDCTTTCCDFGTFYAKATGSVVETLSDEYTTADIISDVDTALAAASFGSWGVACEAFYDLDSDELSATKQKLEYNFVLPDMTGYSCYKIMWEERFTPAGGGSPSYTSKSYQWDGVATESPVNSIAAPSTEGTTDIVNISYTCACS